MFASLAGGVVGTGAGGEAGAFVTGVAEADSADAFALLAFFLLFELPLLDTIFKETEKILEEEEPGRFRKGF